MSKARFLVAVAAVASLALLAGCNGTPRPDPVPDKPTPPLTAYWPTFTTPPDAQPVPQPKP